MEANHKVSDAIGWSPGEAPVAVIMISLNEEHNMRDVLDNLGGWAQEVFLIDSYSTDKTVDIALSYGVHVVQRRFHGFGDQWNWALKNLPITSKWTMKLDPDERMSNELKHALKAAVYTGNAPSYSLGRRLWFMGRPLPVRQKIPRVWLTGKCIFTDVKVNEHPIVIGPTVHVIGDLEHFDSPTLDHWIDKQNKYTTTEAHISVDGAPLSDRPYLFGTSLQRKMWIKKNFYKIPLFYFWLFLYHWLWLGAYRAGFAGYVWSRYRSEVMRMIAYKRWELKFSDRLPNKVCVTIGSPDPRVRQFD